MAEKVAHAVGIAPDEWFAFKTFIERALGISPDALHVIVAVALQIAVAAVLRTSVARWSPWLVVLALELLNEWSDLSVDRWPDAAMQYGEGAKDIVLTMALPTLLLVVSRRFPRLLSRTR